MKNVLKNFVHHLDAMNSISGGTVATSVDVNQSNQQIDILIKAPTVSSDAFNIFVQGNKLIVYTILRNEVEDWMYKEEKDISSKHMVPMFNQIFDIPENVSVDHIEAIFENGSLRLILPFNESSGVPMKRIHIKEY